MDRLRHNLIGWYSQAHHLDATDPEITDFEINFAIQQKHFKAPDKCLQVINNDVALAGWDGTVNFLIIHTQTI